MFPVSSGYVVCLEDGSGYDGVVVWLILGHSGHKARLWESVQQRERREIKKRAAPN